MERSERTPARLRHTVTRSTTRRVWRLARNANCDHTSLYAGHCQISRMPTSFSISGGAIVTPSRVRSSNGIRIEGDRIAGVGRSRALVSERDIRVPDGTFVFPALLNIHDHMRSNYLPRVGPCGGRLYTMWSDWNDDLQASDTVAERNRALGIADIYALSSYKNILSGVATIHDHFPHAWNEPFVSRQPLNVVREYTISHDVSRYALPWGSGVRREHQLAKKKGWPFITHHEEGFDAEVQAGVDLLERLRCLDDYTVMIHCIGFSDDDIRRVARAGAHAVWCGVRPPTSTCSMSPAGCGR